MSKILGIDLGTTNSVMSIIQAGEPVIVENKEGARTTPSVVAITKTKEKLTGIIAKRQSITNATNTIFSMKRFIGRQFDDPEIQKIKKTLPYQLRKDSNGEIEIKMEERWYKTAEISAMILQKLKTDAEAKIGEKIFDAIITCPAYFNDAQRKNTKIAGEIAGFNVRRIINEPTAAALAYGLNKKKDEKIMVFDFGGGTFDISILDISQDTIEVKGIGGDTTLGGDDFDQEIINWILKKFKQDQGIDLSKDTLALQRIKEVSEKAKIELSNTLETEINLPFVTSGSDGPLHLSYKLTRAQLEILTDKYIKKAIEITKKVIKKIDLKMEDINEIVLVGGQTRMPKIQEEIQKIFKNKKLNKTINPDEVVAIGAAIQAGIMQGDVRDVLLLDVTPLSLGIETLGGVNTTLIPHDTTIPVSKTQIFSTAADNQPSVEIHVLQGERPLAKDNKTLGRFMLTNIPPAPRGIPQIEVSFDIDANGILNVSAKDKATGRQESIKIESSGGLSKEEIEEIKKNVQEHAEEDKKKQEIIEAKNIAESLIYTTEQALKNLKDKISKEEEKEINEKIKELTEIKNKDKVILEEIKSKTKELSEIMQKITTKAYQETQKKDKDEQVKNEPRNEEKQDKEKQNNKE